MFRRCFKAPKFSSSGLTLVELLIVIGIIGILAGGLVTLLNPSQQINKANDGRRRGDLVKIQAALELYRGDLGSYPLSLPACNAPLTSGGAAPKTYLERTPCDPTRTGWYNGSRYYYTSNGSTYTLIACLANSRDTNGTAGQPPGGGCATNRYYQAVNP